MPRQAVRVVLGRSAKAPSTTTARLRPFSTTPKRRDDDASKPPTRRDRSVAAASAISALSQPSQPSQRPGGSSPAPQMKPVTSQNPHAAALGARLGANVISVRSLPKRREGDGSGPVAFRKVSFSKDGSGGPSQGFQRPQTGKPGGNVVRAGGFKPGPDGPRFARPAGFRGQQAGGPGSRSGGAGGKKAPFKRGGGGARKRRDDNKKKEMDEAKQTGIKGLSEETQAYVREQEVGGPETAYTPSVTLESLVGWGPAVATNTALGQADLAARSMKTLGGGRGASEGEQAFKIGDVRKWLRANKPIYFSSVEQKQAVIETLAPARRKNVAKGAMQARVDRCRSPNGDNWGGFVDSLKAWAAEFAASKEGEEMVGAGLIKSDARPEEWLKMVSEVKAASRLEGEATRFMTQNTENTKEAIHKFVLKGEHPEVKYAEDVYGKLATYHAQGSTYTIADGAKFDEKIRKLVKVAPAPAAGQPAPKAAAP